MTTCDRGPHPPQLRNEKVFINVANSCNHEQIWAKGINKEGSSRERGVSRSIPSGHCAVVEFLQKNWVGYENSNTIMVVHSSVRVVKNFQLTMKQLIKVTSKQVYHTDEITLFWICKPINRLAIAEDTGLRIKESKVCVTVVACTNAAGPYKLKMKLLVVGKRKVVLQLHIASTSTLQENWVVNIFGDPTSLRHMFSPF
ncbi:hypothetical protein PR048_011438 [Dryococelus australis]|uniref:Uncharacterized protein n=1 Tax=Dryococelus australis TaxID=614101 RepID=A0ABQ9HLL3_9NEOP|nr:hypothetical protein PR048_011438 [Dryococelus australis]